MIANHRRLDKITSANFSQKNPLTQSILAAEEHDNTLTSVLLKKPNKFFKHKYSPNENRTTTHTPLHPSILLKLIVKDKIFSIHFSNF